MFFSQEDYKKIYDWLKCHSIKDSEFAITDTIYSDDTIVILRNGKNYRVSLDKIFNLAKPIDGAKAKFGISVLETITEAEIANLDGSKNIAEGVAGTYTIRADGNSYMWICIPKRYTIPLNSVTIGGIRYEQPKIYLNDMIFAFMQPIVVGDYNCYRTPNKVYVGTTYNLEIKKDGNL